MAPNNKKAPRRPQGVAPSDVGDGRLNVGDGRLTIEKDQKALEGRTLSGQSLTAEVRSRVADDRCFSGLAWLGLA